MKDIYLLHQLISRSASTHPEKEALLHKGNAVSYTELWSRIKTLAHRLNDLNLEKSDRVAVYLPKQIETVVSLFGSVAGGYTMVPVNPVLKSPQVAYILRDCNVRTLITSRARLASLLKELPSCPDLRFVILTDGDSGELPTSVGFTCLDWNALNQKDHEWSENPRAIDTDMAAILYTSGSTGRPKGVVLSHRNMLAGAFSVAEYLNNTQEDRLLAVLPFSFDYGLSQLTTAFSVGASVVLFDYLLPKDVIRATQRYSITGLAAVPPLWNQIAGMEWPDDVKNSLRYITNSGGAMPKNTTKALRTSLPDTDIYLMYGLTEAFRSTYLPPELVDTRPDSIGKAIPNSEVLVVREDGTECTVNEPGELVHRGSLVALGYWNDPEKTHSRFKPAPGQTPEIPTTELAVWSGDKVRRDEDGYLYFVGRSDEMIKTSGYRVSPTEVEEVIYAIAGIGHAVALGARHPMLGQAIVLIAQTTNDAKVTKDQVLQHCKNELPNFMQPAHVDFVTDLPRNPNGKIDRAALKSRYDNLFEND